MADYYTIIRQAVERSDSRTGEARRVIYERARTALLRKLRSGDSPLSDSEITRQRLALEDAIRKVESEMAQAMMRDTATALGKEQQPEDGAAPSEPQPRPRSEPPVRERAPEPASEGEEARPRPQAPPAARPATSRPMPRMPSRSADLPPLRSRMEPPQQEPDTPPPVQPLRSEPQPAMTPAARGSDRPAVMQPNPLKERLASRGGGFGAAAEARRPEPDPAEEDPTILQPRFGRAVVEERDPDPEPEEDEYETDEDYDEAYDEDEDETPERGFRQAFATVLAVAALILVVGFAYWQRDAIGRMFEGQKVVQGVQDGDAAVPATKDEERVPQDGAQQPPDGTSPQSAQLAPAKVLPPSADPTEGEAEGGGVLNDPGAAAGQRSVLYEEGNPGESGSVFNGKVSWSTEPDESAPPALLIRGLVDIPERGLKLLLTVRRNADQNLPASHIIELLFEVQQIFPTNGIANVPGILMKANEPARGVALAGASKRATDSYFLIGLSANAMERTRNVDLLRNRGWIDVPILYTNKRRAILTVEKGTEGERIFADAFASWGE